MRNIVQSANIVRTAWPARMNEHLNLYLGNGRMGCCLDAWGLMNKGAGGPADASVSNTQLMHADHWDRGEFGLDSWLAVAQLKWRRQTPPDPVHYRQTLDLWTARLTTEMTCPGLLLTTRACFHAEHRDLLAVEIDYQGAMPPLVLSPATETVTGHYSQPVAGSARTVAVTEDPPTWLCRLHVGRADTLVALRVAAKGGPAELRPGQDGLEIHFPAAAGKVFLTVGVCAAARQEQLLRELGEFDSFESFAASSASAWQVRWGRSFIEVPQPDYQALWVRSIYYLLATFAPEVRSPAPPCGWTNNAWPRHFPQDVSCPAAALLRTNHLDEVRCWVEFYRSCLEPMKAFTSDIWKTDGVMWAWEFPIGRDCPTLLRGGAPNHCQYEIHNSGYVAFMASQAAKHLADATWARDVAWPLVRESATFYACGLKQETDGLWSLHLTPSMGQDESGPPDCKNYLDALNSARYCLQAALAMAGNLGIDEQQFQRWRRILSDGLAYRHLLDERVGIYATCEAPDGRPHYAIGRQKHPIQLTPLSYLPIGEVDGPTRNAHERRHDLCQRASDHEYWGWTLVDMMLASARIGSAGGLLKDLSELQPSRLVDPHWIQIYEGTHKHHRAYYTTSHAWYALALCDALVTDWFGRVEIAKACPAQWPDARFENLRTADGRLWSGKAGEHLGK